MTPVPFLVVSKCARRPAWASLKIIASAVARERSRAPHLRWEHECALEKVQNRLDGSLASLTSRPKLSRARPKRLQLGP
jgi:hypothetical protein